VVRPALPIMLLLRRFDSHLTRRYFLARLGAGLIVSEWQKSKKFASGYNPLSCEGKPEQPWRASSKLLNSREEPRPLNVLSIWP
jgi:hypothetical protein